uniref:Uncharacterized protein n=1 Tax=Rhizophora mucronata TaxID=61149 RepID=A0A2P2NXJ6_RHIMU
MVGNQLSLVNNVSDYQLSRCL